MFNLALAVARRGSRAKRPISISEGFRVEAAFDAGYEACLGQPTQHDLEAQLDEASPGEVEAAIDALPTRDELFAAWLRS